MSRKPRVIHIELGRGHLRWKRNPPVPVAEKEDEVRRGRQPLTQTELFHAGVHGLLVKRRFFARPPAEINRLEARFVLFAQFPELGEDVPLQRVPFSLEIVECRTDEDPVRLAGQT